MCGCGDDEDFWDAEKSVGTCDKVCTVPLSGEICGGEDSMDVYEIIY